jgi:hypothetical protein
MKTIKRDSGDEYFFEKKCADACVCEKKVVILQAI